MGKKSTKKKQSLKPKRRSQVSKQKENLGDDNEIDAFNSARDKILLRDYDANQGEDSDSEEVQPVMDLDSDLEDSDEDPFAAEEREQYEENRKRAIDHEQKISKAWKRGEMYGADTAEFELMGEDEADDLANEEKEAMRLQKEQAQAFDDTDFEMQLPVVTKTESRKESKKESKKKKSKRSKKSKKSATASEALAAVNAELEDVTLDLGVDNQTVRVPKNTSSLTKEEQLDIVLTDAPEVFALVEEMEAKIKEIQSSLQPTLAKVQSNELATSDGLSFLQVKLQLMLSYLTNITFLLMLRAEGRPIKNHPVVAQLARLRVVMEKIRPVDKRLKYQVDKLLRLGAGEEEEEAQEAGANPLSFKPNPAALESSSTALVDSSGVYRIPKNSTRTFDDSTTLTKQQKRAEKLRLRASQSKLVKELRADLYSDAPERVEMHGDALRIGDAEDREKRSYEEDNFLRLMETKKDKAKAKAKQRISTFADFDDFGDLNMITHSANVLPTKSQLKARAPAPRASFHMDDSDLKEGLETYLKASNESTARRAKRKADHPVPVSMLDEKDLNFTEDSKGRAIGNEIMDNRGLTRYRPRDKKNPRKRYRLNYEKALIKRKGTTKEFSAKPEAYGGEQTGIKRSLVRSQKL